MKVTETKLAGVLVIEPDVFADDRGYFLETFRAEHYAEAGMPGPFLQDNLSFSLAGVLRGLHLQNPSAQAKLVFVPEGEIFDVAVDVRTASPTFGQWVGARLCGDNRRQFYIPPPAFPAIGSTEPWPRGPGARRGPSCSPAQPGRSAGSFAARSRRWER
jgi:dTDP-4-dehydrorhamnose 3,5-epimerase